MIPRLQRAERGRGLLARAERHVLGLAAHGVLHGHGLRGRVDRGFKVTDDRVDVRLAGLLLAGGGHQAAAELVDRGFPDFRLLGGIGEVHRVQGQASGPVRGVVALAAVVLDHAREDLVAIRGSHRFTVRNGGNEGEPGHRCTGTGQPQHASEQ